MKKIINLLVGLTSILAICLASLTSAFAQGAISVVSREDGSGTRGAFVEIVGVLDENDEDATTEEADIQNGTSGVMQTVAGNVDAIGYISLGSLDDTIKAVKIEGVEATAENVKSGDYKLVRAFNVAWKKDSLSDVSKDFLNYIYSTEGQAIVEAEGYITVDEVPEVVAGEAGKAIEAFATSEVEGTINIAGSTSVDPVMQKLAEAYKQVNDKVEINITANGSSAGMTAAIDGSADLGMASRDLKEEEAAELDAAEIAHDGIAVIVNTENTVEDLSLDQIKQIFLGELTEWAELTK